MIKLDGISLNVIRQLQISFSKLRVENERKLKSDLEIELIELEKNSDIRKILKTIPNSKPNLKKFMKIQLKEQGLEEANAHCIKQENQQFF